VFATPSETNVSAELHQNPYAEIGAYDTANRTAWRVHGKSAWIENFAAKVKRLKATPEVKSLCKRRENPIFKVFCIEGSADVGRIGTGPRSVVVNQTADWLKCQRKPVRKYQMQKNAAEYRTAQLD
jgi:hypothetical protein